MSKLPWRGGAPRSMSPTGAPAPPASALPPAMTREQGIRGRDGAIDWVLLVTGYVRESVARLSDETLSCGRLAAQQATAITSALYQLDHSLCDREVEPEPAA